MKIPGPLVFITFQPLLADDLTKYCFRPAAMQEGRSARRLKQACLPAWREAARSGRTPSLHRTLCGQPRPAKLTRATRLTHFDNRDLNAPTFFCLLAKKEENARICQALGVFIDGFLCISHNGHVACLRSCSLVSKSQYFSLSNSFCYFKVFQCSKLSSFTSVSAFDDLATGVLDFFKVRFSQDAPRSQVLSS